MLGWIWVTALCIIWIAFLLPSRRVSPASTVEEFERKMTMLAEANKAPSGRWVMVPGKGERLLGIRERNRLRVRRRRRVVLTVLIETTVLTLLMALFPPLRPMLYVTAVLGGVLFLYLLLLLKLRTDEARRARTRRILLARERARQESTRPAWPDAAEMAGWNDEDVLVAGNGSRNGNGNGGRRAVSTVRTGPARATGSRTARSRSARNGVGRTRVPTSSANGRSTNGRGHPPHDENWYEDVALDWRRSPLLDGYIDPEVESLTEGDEVQFAEDGLHVVIRRPGEVGAGSARAASR